MSSHYEHFRELKKEANKANSEHFAERTLKYYQTIQEMLGRREYENNWSFLQKMMEFIEEKEFLSEKQIEVVEVISQHPEGGTDDNGDYSPF